MSASANLLPWTSLAYLPRSLGNHHDVTTQAIGGSEILAHERMPASFKLLKEGLICGLRSRVRLHQAKLAVRQPVFW